MNRILALRDEPFAWGGDSASIHSRWQHKHEMPFAVVGGALAATFAGGVAAAGAIGITGVAASVVGGIAVVSQVAMYVGLAMTVVGAVTGNKDLMKIGGYVGLAGGVGSLAIGAMGAVGGALGATASTVTGTGFNAVSNAAAPVTAAAGTVQPIAAAPAMTALDAAGNATSTVIPQGSSATTALTYGGGQVGNIATPAVSNAANVASSTKSLTPAFDSVNAAKNVGLNNVDTAAKVGADVGKNTGFFDFIKSDGGASLIKVGAGMLTGSAEEDMNKKQFKLQQQNQAYEQMVKERAYRNANSLPSNLNGLSVTPLTPEQQAAALDFRTQNNIKQAKAITAAAGTR